jgi:DNA-binding SARP family transcriptional activator
VRIRTLGGFRVDVDGRELSLESVKPRARTLLRLLAVHAGAPVHREVIGDALWPEADAQTAARSLQVAVSALRRTFVDAVGEDGGRLIARDGDAYRLAVGPDVVDIGRLEAAVVEARAARGRGEPSARLAAAVLVEYGGELLPEEGPAEWVVEPRERFQAEAVEAARAVAEEALLEGDCRTAIEACRGGLGIDRYSDPLWRMLIDARDRAGDVGAATRDRREYEGVLAELGLDEAPAVTASA